jgi:hypothetical protein
VQGHALTIRWQRGDAAEDGFQDARVVAPGQPVQLAELPANARLLVCAPPPSGRGLG